MNKIINGVASEYDIPMIYKNKTTTNSLENEEVFTRWQDPTIEKLRQEKDQPQNNWNELKKLVEQEKQDKKYANDVERFTAYDYVLKKMQELEGKSE